MGSEAAGILITLIIGTFEMNVFRSYYLGYFEIIFSNILFLSSFTLRNSYIECQITKLLIASNMYIRI